MDQINLREILTKYKTVAVIGLSQNPVKDSYRVAEYLKNHGFQIIPINPTANEILGNKCYNSLVDIPAEIQKTVEIVDIFRPSEEVLSIVEQAALLKKIFSVPYVIWMQLGIVNEEAAEKASNAGFIVIMDRCMMQEHQHLF